MYASVYVYCLSLSLFIYIYVYICMCHVCAAQVAADRSKRYCSHHLDLFLKFEKQTHADRTTALRYNSLSLSLSMYIYIYIYVSLSLSYSLLSMYVSIFNLIFFSCIFNECLCTT